MTTVYLIRHGIAAERGTYAVDDDRPLTERGRDRTGAIAQRLHQWGIRFDALLTSPLCRAQETAQILVATGLAPQAEIHPPLSPGGTLQDWLTWLSPWQALHPRADLALVGHEPDLTTWAQSLLYGNASGGESSVPAPWVLKKGGILGLKLPPAPPYGGHSSLFLLVPPRFILGS